jgi:very-short-patch-repair endonuclease
MNHDLYRRATSQHGLVTRSQLTDLGFNHKRVKRWVTSGKLDQLDVNVFAVGGTPSSPRTDLLAAILETGHDASASHTTAAALWGIAGYRLTPHHVVVTRISRHHHRLPWKVHQFTGLIADHRRWIDHIPVTSPALTMLHLASMVSQKRLERAVDNAWSLGLITGRDLIELDERLARQGRDGIVALRKATGDRDENWIPPQSNLESRFMDLMRTTTGLTFRRQVPISTERWTARVDFLHEPSRTIVEVQSERYHAALTDQAADDDRRRNLEGQGYVVIEVWDNELFRAPRLVVERVGRAIHRAA